MHDILQGVYRPYRSLPELLKALMRALATRLELQEGSLWLREAGTLLLNRSGSEFTLDWLDDAASDGPHSSIDAASSLTLPIPYAGTHLGELRLTWRKDAGLDEARSALCTAFARHCALMFMRYEIQRWAQQRLGHALLLVGNCEPLRRLEVFVEKAASSVLPVLLAGEFGTEKAQVAVALHCCGPRRDGPFFEVNCADPAGQPAQWFEQARGGTLFFNGIDELAPRLQGQLPQHLHSRLGQWLAVPDANEVRVVASTTADLRQLVSEGRFSRALLAELDFLSATVPPLRTRTADIEQLVTAALERQGYRCEQKQTDDLIALCKTYAWPENLFELERVIARLAVMTDGHPIHHADVLRYAPWMVGEAPVSSPVVAESPVVPEPASELPVSTPPEHWARCATTRDLVELNKLHGGLRKALLYLGEHYAEPISLGQLAQQAHVSPSHLSYLFRSVLNTAFKSLLQLIRVEKAKEILAKDGQQRITEVALSVGFADLSHFEKSFRRMVGRSPREFRRAGV